MDPLQSQTQVLSTANAIQEQTKQLQDLSIPVVVETGDKIVRVDQEAPIASPHLSAEALDDAAAIDTTKVDPSQSDNIWQPSIGTPVLAWPDVKQNDLNMQFAAEEMAQTLIDRSTQVKPTIHPAWEVDNFRWPKVAQQFLEQHGLLFDQIGNAILQSMTITQGRVGVCSGQRQEGKTILSICLAEWAARLGKSVLLLDADSEHPKLSYMSGVNPELGWRNVIDGELPIPEALIRSSETKLTLLPLVWDKMPKPSTGKLLDRLCQLVCQLRYEFDLVIMDLGTVEHLCSKITAGMDFLDYTLVVRDAFQTSNGQLMETKSILENLGFPQISVAENFCRRAG